MAIAFDRQSGLLKKMLVTSVSRGNMIMSYVFSTMLKTLEQVAILIAVAVLLGMQTSNLTAIVLLAIGLSAFFK